MLYTIQLKTPKLGLIRKLVWRVPLICSFLLLFLPFSNAQTAGTKRIVGTFIYEKSVYNYEFTKENTESNRLNIHPFTFDKKTNESKTKALADSAGVDSIVTGKASAVSDPVSADPTSLSGIFEDFAIESFREIFTGQMGNYVDTTSTHKIKLSDKATQLFFSIQARLEILDDEPVTANLILRKDVITSILSTHAAAYYYDGGFSKVVVDHRIDRVSVETEDGAIKNIVVRMVGTEEGTKSLPSLRKFIEFKNQFPISISSRNDPEKFANNNLYCFNCYGVKGLTRYIKLSDLLMMDIVLENDKEDYSPANTLIDLSPTKPIVELKKGRRSRIIEMAAFTDFVGLNQEQPNGLIQFEAKRKINLNTIFYPGRKTNRLENISSKYDFSKYDIIFDSLKQVKKKETMYIYSVRDKSTKTIFRKDIVVLKSREIPSAYFNFLGSIEPKLLFSKLEENNKYLLLSRNNSSGNTINTLDLYQHQLASLGVSMSICKISYPQAKVNWNVLDVSAFWFKTSVKEAGDSSKINSESVNNSYLSLGTGFSVRPDSRWGAALGASYMKQNILNEKYSMNHHSGLFQLAFDGHLKSNYDSKLFFRFRWTFDTDNFDKNFTQLQLGYSVNIFASKGGYEKKE